MWKSVTIAALAMALASFPLVTNAQGCPPGLAKKSPACVPPGQAKHRAQDHRLSGDYVVVRDRHRYGLPPLGPGEQYYRMGDRILRVDERTKQVLDIIALAATLAD